MLPFSKLGLANSVAYQEHYSWQVTIELAKQKQFSTIQLYVNDTNIDENHLTIIKEATQLFNIHLHLPSAIASDAVKEFLDEFLAISQKEVILIQHQRYWFTVDEIKPILRNRNVLIAIENDLPKTKPIDFLNFLLKTRKDWSGLIPVLDISRFFVQKPIKENEQKIKKQLLEMLKTIIEYNWPFILHTIDHAYHQLERHAWQPLFEGQLPWSQIFKIMEPHLELLKCLMFEYENWDMVERSIENMRSLNFLKL